MRRDVPAVRILPMSDKLEGFRQRSIADVQQRLFLRDLPRCGGRFRYPRMGLSAASGTIVLFQFKARIIASAVFLRDEKFTRPRRGCAGAMHFDPASIRTFAAIDAATMRQVWPAFRAFGHVKQHLHPMRYRMLKRWLKHVARPVAHLSFT
jgi:hypothetical protein